MNLFEKFKHKLSTNLKFVAFLSILFQLWFLLFTVFKIYFVALFFFLIIFYFYIIVIGISRYVEVKSENFKQKIINFFWLLNCFPFIIISLWLIIFFLPINSQTETINPEDIKYTVIDENGNEVEKKGNEIKIDVKNKRLVDSIVRVKIKE